MRDTLIERTVKEISRAPAECCLLRRHSQLELTSGVLENHDGVVDHEPGRDGERHERKVVRLKPHRYMTPKVEISDTGTASAGNERRPEFRKKMNTTRTTTNTERR